MPRTTKKEWEAALKKDEADLRWYEDALKKIQRGESVENLSEDGAKSVIRGLQQVIKNKKGLMRNLSASAVASELLRLAKEIVAADEPSNLNKRERQRVKELWDKEPDLTSAERRELKQFEKRMRGQMTF